MRSTPVVEWGTESLAARGLDLEWLEPDGHGGYADIGGYPDFRVYPDVGENSMVGVS